MTVGMVLLTVLKIIGIVLLCILGLFLLICLIPVGVTAEYSGDGPKVTAKAGPFPVLRILPKKPKPEPTPDEAKAEKQERARRKKQAKQEKKQKKKQAKKQAGAASRTPEKKEFLGGNLPMFKELLGLVLPLLSTLRRKLKIRELILYLNMAGGGEDPAKAARLYGTAWAGIGNLWTVLERVFIIQNPDVRVNVDFLTTETTVYAKGTVMITVGAVVKMGLVYGFRALKIYLKHKKSKRTGGHRGSSRAAVPKSKKGGKQHGTSSQ